MMSWEEVTQAPGVGGTAYGGLKPTQQYNMQLDYFDDVVAPVLMKNGAKPDDIKVKFKEFFTEYPPPEGFSPEYFPKRLKKTMNMQSKQIADLDVDRERSVQHFPFQTAYERAKGTEEKNAVFQKFGLTGDDVFPMRLGGHALNPSGMEKLGLEHHGEPTSIKGTSNIFNANTLAAGSVEATKIVPEVAAGIMGAKRGLGGSALMTSLTGGGVEAIDEGVKHLQGFQRRDPGAILKDVGVRAITAPIADTGVRALQAPARKLALGPQASGGRIRDMFGFSKLKQHPTMLDSEAPHIGRQMDAKPIAQVEGALDMGLRPTISRAGESARFPVTGLVGKAQGVLNNILGDGNQFFNTARAEVLADALTKKGSGSFKNMIGEETFGKTLGKKAGATVGKQNQTIAQSLAQADNIVDKSVKQLGSRGEGGLWDYSMISNSIKSHKSNFSAEMSEQIKFLDQANASVKNIPSQPIKNMIKEWADDFPDAIKIVDGEVVETGKAWMSPEMKTYLNDAMHMEGSISFKQLHNLRTMFSASAFDDGLVKTVTHHRAGVMKTLLDDMAESSPTLSTKLKKFNADYKAGMDKYDDALVLGLAKQGKDRIPLNHVSDRLLAMDKSAADKLKGILPKEDWAKMGDNIFNDMLRKSEDAATGHINATKMLENVQTLRNNETFHRIYTPKQGAEITRALKNLESRGWEGNLSKLLVRDTDVSSVLQQAIKQQNRLNDYMKDNFVTVLTGAHPEKAMGWALYNNTQAKQMMEHIGGDAQMIDKARQLVLRRGLSSITSKGSNTVAPVLDDSLSKFIRKFEGMPENPAKTILGKDLWKELKGLGEAFEQVKAGGGGGAGMAAANEGMKFIQHPLKFLPKSMKFGVAARILSNPSFVRYMTTGLKKGVGGGFGVNQRKAVGAFFRTLSQGFMEAAQAEGYTPPKESFDLKDSEVYQELMN